MQDGSIDPVELKVLTDKAPLSSFYQAQYINLNGGGLPQLLVFPKGMRVGGSAHCEMSWIYAKKGKSYRRILRLCTGGRAHSPLPLNTSTNGYRDIISENDCCLNNVDVSVFKFDGTEYKKRISKWCVVKSADDVQCKDSKSPLN